MTQAPRNVAILHHTGGGNLGDNASVEAVLRNIRLRWPEAVISIVSMNPEDTAERFAVPSLSLRRHHWSIGYAKPDKGVPAGTRRAGWRRWLRSTRFPLLRLPRAMASEFAFLVASRRRIRHCDLLVLSGGGQLTDRSGPWGFPYAVLTWFLLAKSAGVQCLVLNVGAGPLFRPLSRFFVKRALFLADYVSFRDEPSQQLARKIGFHESSCVCPDNVYGLEVPVSRQVREPGRDRQLVGLAPMPYPVDPPFQAGQNKAIYDDVIARFASFAALLAGRSYALQLFGTDVGVDPGSIRDLQDRLRQSHGLAPLPQLSAPSVADMLAGMAKMDYVVTCRFHGVVFAHLLNKPVLAISHHPKVADLMSALGLARYCVDIRTFNPASLAETFDGLVRESGEVRSRMAASLARWQSVSKIQFDQLFAPSREGKFPAFDPTSCAALLQRQADARGGN